MSKTFRISILCLLLLTALACLPALAQQEAFIYGEVTLDNNEKHKGKIFWSGGQRMWVEMLTVEKKDNPVLKYLNNEELRKLSEEEQEKQMDWGFMNLWKNRYPSRKLPLRCRFGDIDEMTITGEREALIVLKNGERISVYTTDDPEYHRQLGEKISVHNAEQQKITFDWNRIVRIRFMETPSRLPQANSIPLFGTVLTRSGFSYTGLIKWDMDEQLYSDFIDGLSSEQEKKRFQFQEIQSIRPKENGALVKLLSQEEIFLHGNSNVDKSNRGILVMDPAWGQVNIRWRDFKGVSFLNYPENAGFGYKAFLKGKALKGQVRTTDDESWEGYFIYDLDEKFDIETLDGWDKAGALRQVPFGFIQKVYPIDAKRAAIILKDGKKLILADRSDVNEKNWGILVFLPQEKYKYIPWNKVNWISFH